MWMTLPVFYSHVEEYGTSPDCTQWYGFSFGYRARNKYSRIGRDDRGGIWKKCNINWGGRPYRERDIMYAVAPIAKNMPLIGWKAKIGISEGIKIRE